MSKEFIRFPLKINAEKNRIIDMTIHQLNMENYSKVSKQKFIMDAIEEKINKQKEQSLNVSANNKI